MLEILLLLALSFTPSAGIHCELDEDLDMVQEYDLKLPHDPRDLDYWKTFNLEYQVYGKFVGPIGDTKLTAGYYTAEDNLIYSITVDCGSGTWKSEYIERGDDSGKLATYLEGNLDSGCTADATFDVWFKVHQPMLMSWLFDGQPLQTETDKIIFFKGQFAATRTRPKKVIGQYGAHKAARFSVKASGAAKLTRLTFGQCVTWPRELDSDCMGARQWVVTRSKLAQDAGGAGFFGANRYLFAPVCFLKSRYFNYLQEYIHPDRNSGDGSYCCCVNMATGRLFSGDVDEDCSWWDRGSTCERSCTQAGDADIIKKVMAEQEAHEGEVGA